VLRLEAAAFAPRVDCVRGAARRRSQNGTEPASSTAGWRSRAEERLDGRAKLRGGVEGMGKLRRAAVPQTR
jgi:hypothetical protein